MLRTRCQASRMLAPVRQFSTCTALSDPGLNGASFSAPYEPPGRVRGPLGSAGLSPRSLKRHLDRFVVGQDRAKKVLSVAMFNHYMRIQETQRREQARHRHRRRQADQLVQPFDEAGQSGHAPGQTTQHPSDSTPSPSPATELSTQQSGSGQHHDRENPDLPILEKSNVLLLGPTGVGKTLLAKTLADALDVPFSISDCTPFTQAGYIGEDADVCVSRLLTAANYDVARAEHGIIVLDEVDKLAARKVTGGRDVSGEGVQQALLKIIEGTTIQIQAKSEKGTRQPPPASPPPGSPTGTGSGRHDVFPHTTSLGPSGLSPGGFGGMPSTPKGDVYNVRTDNILFICTGAFIGLHKLVLDRVSKGSIGFGARIRSTTPKTGVHETLLERSDEDVELFRRHVPFYVPPEDHQTGGVSHHSLESPAPDSMAIHYPFPEAGLHSSECDLNALDLVSPTDLQEYGLIPELVGRIPIHASLAALSQAALLRVMTEPQNNLISQYSTLFRLSRIRLRFTRAALEEIASAALSLGTGARGLRSIVEGVLADAMFEAPGSETEHVIITREVAQRKAPAICLPGRMGSKADEIVAREERQWERDWIDKHGSERATEAGIEPVATTFEEFRSREAIGGFA